MLITSPANTSVKSIFNSVYFWLLFAGSSIVAGIASYHYFPKTFEFLDITISVNRNDVMAQAAELAKTNSIGPKDFSSTAYFSGNTYLQHYVELQAGGKNAWKDLIKEGLYHPYTWKVRHYKEGDINEVTFAFTPEGKPYGYQECISENAPGAALKSEQAREVAQKFITAYGIDLSRYYIAEASEYTQPSGRIDHTIDYELLNRTLGEAYYRFCVKISGDKVTQLHHYVHIPEKFDRVYAQMRSKNNTIYTAGTVFIFILYGIIGCLISLIVLLIRRRVTIRPVIIWAAIMAFGQGLLFLNDFPIHWADYNTAHSSTGFMIDMLLFALRTVVSWFIVYALSFAAAESLTRKAFPEKLQFWKLFTAPLATTRQVWGQVWGAYIIIPFDILFLLAFYTIGSKYFGFWNPSQSLIDPNVMSSFVPAFGSLMKSLSAGFWEECLFRAVPIAGAAIIGEKLGNKKLGIILGFILQIFVFGAAHANYPGQPSFVRLIELIIPSCMFGVLYLRFGLLAGIISHTIFDAILFSIPIFASQAQGSFTQKIIVIFSMLIPIFIILLARIKNGALTTADKEYTYGALDAQDDTIITEPEDAVIEAQPLYFSRNVKISILVGTIVAAFLGIHTITQKPDVPPLRVSKNVAVQVAQATSQDLSLTLPEKARLLTIPHTQNSSGKFAEKFILDTAGKETYKKLLGSYIQVPHWQVRCASFEGDLETRAEEFSFSVDSRGKMIQIKHTLPESASGKELEESDARKLAFAYIEDYYSLQQNEVREISASSEKRPNRKDWQFIFEDMRYKLPQGQTRIAVVLAGNEVTDSYPFIFVPEDWSRKEEEQNQTAGIIHQVQFALLGLLFLLAAWYNRSKIFNFLTHKKILALFGGMASILYIGSITLDFPNIVANFTTSLNFSTQVLTTGMGCVIGLAFVLFLLLMGIQYIYSAANTTQYSPYRFAVLAAIAASIFDICVTKYLTNIMHETILWPNLLGCNSFMPIVSVVASLCLTYIFNTTRVAVISLLWPRKGIVTSVGIGLLMGLSITGFTFSVSLPIWLLCALIQGLIVAILMECIYTKDLSLVPVVTVVPLMFQACHMVLFPGYPGAAAAGLLTVIVLTVSAFVWSKSLRSKRQTGD